MNWFNNGPAEQFLQFTVEKSRRQRQVAVRRDTQPPHPYPGGWTEAGDLIAGDRVLAAEPHRLSDQQFQVVLGSLMGDGNLSPNPAVIATASGSDWDTVPSRSSIWSGRRALMGNIKHSRQ